MELTTDLEALTWEEFAALYESARNAGPTPLRLIAELERRVAAHPLTAPPLRHAGTKFVWNGALQAVCRVVPRKPFDFEGIDPRTLGNTERVLKRQLRDQALRNARAAKGGNPCPNSDPAPAD